MFAVEMILEKEVGEEKEKEVGEEAGPQLGGSCSGPGGG